MEYKEYMEHINTRVVRHGTIDNKILRCHDFALELFKKEVQINHVLVSTTIEGGTEIIFKKTVRRKVCTPYGGFLSMVGISVNSTELMTDIDYINKDDLIGYTKGGIFATDWEFEEGDIMRFHTDGRAPHNEAFFDKTKGGLSMPEGREKDGMLSFSEEDKYYGSLSIME